MAHIPTQCSPSLAVPNIKTFGNSFICRTTGEWNSLPAHVFPSCYNIFQIFFFIFTGVMWLARIIFIWCFYGHPRTRSIPTLDSWWARAKCWTTINKIMWTVECCSFIIVLTLIGLGSTLYFNCNPLTYHL